ncbi:solute carrier organic anion transporter family member 3A1-like [Haliotis rufescens]|uniref:solute carrier organic anion transporter family member 3A1-like n=1 Tax=Haliotis rufescens TaxID=6454 RepID=UPI00201EB74B|nr:solute carrier organic anion transporter family member 3A1-like [Haliotis rufescens]XP_048256799.1 solute carrier organic anion transporter family member 3A1-like [Haliotis rufescens]
MEKNCVSVDAMAEPGGRRRRCFNNILWFTAAFSVSSLVLEAVKYHTVSQITSLEKQFGLSSTRSGLLLSCSEIGYLSAIFFFSHFGGRRFIPRILSCALAVYGLASLMSGLLHFMSPVSLPRVGDLGSNYSSHNVRLCQDSVQDNERCPATKDQATDNGHWVYNVLAVLMVIQGMGKSPRFSLGLPYVDNNSRDKQQSSLLAGIIMTVTFFGPALALGLGGVFSAIPVDFSETQMDPLHPQWVGAWWLGYLVFGCAAILLAVPLGCFPRHIKKPTKRQVNGKRHSLKEELSDLPKSVVRVLRNPVVACLLLGNCCVLFFVGGNIAFAPKYIENQFGTQTSKANFIVGVEELLWATVGTLLGGILTSKLKLTNRGCAKLIMIVTLAASACYTLTLLFGCPNPSIKGLGESRHNMTSASYCGCDADEFMPLCGADGETYISPCMAGCKSQNGTTYTGCSEIPGDEATAGRCPTECPYLYPYIIVDLVSGLAGTVSIVPILMTIIKTVQPRDKPMAVALTSFLNGLLGFLPAPIVYGKVIDSSCIFWQTVCGEVGACALYDLSSLRYRVKSMDIGLQSLSAAAYFVAFLLFKYGVVEEVTSSDAADVQMELAEEKVFLDNELTRNDKWS